MSFHEIIFRLFVLLLWDSVPINIHQILINQQFLFYISPYEFSCTMNLLVSCAFFSSLHFKYSFLKWQVELILFLSFFHIWKLSTKLSAFTLKCKACSLDVTRSCANHLNTFEIYLLNRWQMFHSHPQSLIINDILNIKRTVILFFYHALIKRINCFFYQLKYSLDGFLLGICSLIFP